MINFIKNKKTHSRLSKKLTFRVSLTIFILVGLLCALSFISTYIEFTEFTSKELSLATDSSSLGVNSWLDGFSSNIETLGNDEQFIQGVKDLNNFNASINGSIENKAIPESILYTQSKLDSLYSCGDGNILFAYIGTSKNQFQQAPFEELDSNFKCTERDWYTSALKSDDCKISKPYSEHILKTPCITISYPIKENGNVIGVLGVDISLNSLFKNINFSDIGEDGFISFIVEENGKYKFIYNTKEDLNKLTYDKFLVENIEDKENDYKVEKLSNIIKNTKTKKELLSETNFVKLNTVNIDDTKYKISVVKDEFLDLYILVGTSISEINRPLIKLIINLAICGIILNLLSYISLNKHLNKIMSYVSDVSLIVNNLKNKNLNEKIKGDGLNSNDEIGDLSNDVNNMIDSLTSMIEDISKTSSTLNVSSEELSDLASNSVSSANVINTSMQNIATISTEQAKYSQNCVRLSNGLDNKLNNATKSSQQMENLAKEVITTNKKGFEVVSKLQAATSDTNNATSTIESTILKLEEKTEAINSIVDTISNLSEQTNLLSLNASIEAARAGDAGKGFLVVADEVKKLAEQSNISANEIKNIIEDIKSDVNKAVLNAKDVRSIVINQNNSVSDVNNSFNEISASIEKINDAISDVSKLILDVNSDKNNILKALEQMASLNEETSSSCQEVYSTTEEQIQEFKKLAEASNLLNKLAINLNTLTNQFKL